MCSFEKKKKNAILPHWSFCPLCNYSVATQAVVPAKRGTTANFHHGSAKPLFCWNFLTVSLAKRYKQSSFPTKANFLQVHHHRWTTATATTLQLTMGNLKLWLAITFLTYRVMERFCPVTFQVLIPFLNGFYELFNRQMNNINLMDLGNILSVVSS